MYSFLSTSKLVIELTIWSNFNLDPEHHPQTAGHTLVFPVSERSNGSQVDQAHSALMQNQSPLSILAL